MKNTVRVFIAIKIKGAAADELCRVQNNLKESSANVKWTEAENLHLTLKFLGNVQLESLKDISSITRKVCQSHPRFTGQLKDVGVFPNPHYPKIIWAEVDDETETLKRLANALEQALHKSGFPVEQRDFKAHITLGRVRSYRGNEQLIESLKWAAVAAQPVAVEAVTIYKSKLTQTGPLYEPLFEAALAA